jgi:hypothetical protein
MDFTFRLGCSLRGNEETLIEIEFKERIYVEQDLYSL